MPPSVTYATIPIDRVLPVRQALLWPDKPVSHVMVPGDDTALHLGALTDDRLIGVASFFSDPTGARLRKLAVDPAHRGQGIGRALVLRGAENVQAQGIGTLWCDARAEACAFYRRLGFAIDPAPYDKSGRPYYRACLTLG